MLSSLIEVWK